MNEVKQLPSYAYLSPRGVEMYTALTNKGTYNLLTHEIPWKDRYKDLEKHGYRLRPRYHPDWSPSWRGTNRDPTFTEDSVSTIRAHVLDATRVADSFRVSLKVVKEDNKEIDILRYLAEDPRDDSHCLPLLDAFIDPIDPQCWIMVTPYLRPMNDPPFCSVADVVDFVDQTLIGLAFLHDHRVAHRDIAAPNIMMDGRPLYPQGHHPVHLEYTPDNVFDAVPLSRMDHPVQYFFIDFGISHLFDPEASPMLLGYRGRCQEVPELSNTVPYDAYKVDVYALGDVYVKEFTKKYHGVEFLDCLIAAMKRPEPTERPSAQEALRIFQECKSTLTSLSLRWRLRSRTESAPERVVYDGVAIAREGIYHLKRLIS